MQVAAEKRAMQLAAEIGVKLIALCPNFNLGPPLSDRADGTSVGYLKVSLESCSLICVFMQPSCSHAAACVCTSECAAHTGICCRVFWRAQRLRAAPQSLWTSGTWQERTCWPQSSRWTGCRAGDCGIVRRQLKLSQHSAAEADQMRSCT